MAVPELHARAPARRTHGDAAEGRLPPQGRAGRRALVSVHAPEPATPGSARSLLAWRARDKAGLAGAEEGASSPPASFREARESGVRPRIPAGVTESRPEARQKKGSLPLRPCSASLSRGRSVPPPPLQQKCAQPLPAQGTPSASLGRGLGVPGVALTSGPASGAVRAHPPLQERPPAAHRQRGRSRGPLGAGLGLRFSARWASAGARGRAAAAGGYGARSPGVPARGGHNPGLRAPAASYPRRRVLPFETPPARRRGEGAAPTNWGARRAALKSPPRAAARDGAQRSRPGPPRVSRPPRPPERRPRSPADTRRSLPPRARHHGAPARRLAAAAGRRPPAPRGAQPGRCKGESPAGSAPPASRPAPRAPRAAPLSPDRRRLPARPSGVARGTARCPLRAGPRQ